MKCPICSSEMKKSPRSNIGYICNCSYCCDENRFFEYYELDDKLSIRSFYRPSILDICSSTVITGVGRDFNIIYRFDEYEKINRDLIKNAKMIIKNYFCNN